MGVEQEQLVNRLFMTVMERRVLITVVALAITLVIWAIMAKYVTGCYTAICK